MSAIRERLCAFLARVRESIPSELLRARGTSLAGLAILALFLTLQSFELRRYVGVDTRPPAWDQANHMDVALQYLEAFRRGEWAAPLTLEPKHYIPPFPPLYHLSIVPAYATSDPEGNALWSNLFYLALLCAAVFGIALELRRDDVYSAAAAAIAFACVPAVQWLAHTQLIDLSLTACAAAAYWAWLRCDGFRRRRASLALGALVGLGMLHKWSFFAYLFPIYVSLARALVRPDTRRRAAGAVLLACALCAPWYVPRVPLLFQRLVQASADQAVPFWKGGAFFQYLVSMPSHLGPFFFLAALAGIVVCRRRREAWPVFAWIITSYVFWAVVPNRQMRYLLPGLPGLAALIACLPRRVVWALAAVQMAVAANASYHWMGPASFDLPGLRVEVLTENAPAAEDWKLEAVLREVEGLRPAGGLPVQVAVVADDEFFNPLSLVWKARSMGLRGVEIMSAKNKLWELADFVLHKRGTLGPPSVVGDLKRIEASLLDPDSAVHRSFEEKARWRLPGGSIAVLHGRRKRIDRPFPEGEERFDEVRTELFTLQGARIKASGWDQAGGKYGSLAVEASTASVKGLRVTGLKLSFKGALIAGSIKEPAAEGRLLGLDRVESIAATVSAEDLRAFLSARGVRADRLELDDTIRFKGRVKGLPLRAEARLVFDREGGRISVEPLALRVALIPLPARLLSRLLGAGQPLFEVSFEPDRTVVRTRLYASLTRAFPFSARFPDCRVGGGRIECSS